jgi:hypothetical protein
MAEEVEEFMITNTRLVEEEVVLECQTTDAQEEFFQILQAFKDIGTGPTATVGRMRRNWRRG